MLQFCLTFLGRGFLIIVQKNVIVMSQSNNLERSKLKLQCYNYTIMYCTIEVLLAIYYVYVYQLLHI